MANPNPKTAHLEATRIKPGQSGNPAGYSRGRRAVDDLLELIAEKKADRAISARWLQSILEGDFRYMAAYLDRRDGRVREEKERPDGTGTKTLRDFLDDDPPPPKRRAKKKARKDR